MEMTYGSDYHSLPVTSIHSGQGIEVRPDLFQLTVQIVNVAFIGNPEREDWVLVDAGMPNSADQIIEAAEERFGINNPPKAIILTHGHFDHVGSIIECIEHWNVDVFAHNMELPFLTGKTSYIPPDPTVDSGLVAKMSPWFPNEPIQIGRRVHALPADGTVPFLPEWKWLLTDGHTPGHISLFHKTTRDLVAGDAFVTVKQESIYKVFMQELEINGPPKYFTSNWQAAKASVLKLAELNPSSAITGHGKPVEGEALTSGLQKLSKNFDLIARPNE
jgi:glyoxylase-like metal-dependent hydrolase (beta-lactamase superfamily II)